MKFSIFTTYVIGAYPSYFGSATGILKMNNVYQFNLAINLSWNIYDGTYTFKNLAQL